MKWINVKEKLPLYKQVVFFYNKQDGIKFGHYRGDYGNNLHVFKDDEGNINENVVTHWMSLPEPPE